MEKKTVKKSKTVKEAAEPKAKKEVSLEAEVYSQEGKKVDSVKLPESVFGLNWNADLVHQVVVSLMTNKRTNLAHTKDRSEVSGGGKKPWQQKGLGRARHGSTRSPIWVKGGIAHGPRNEKNFDRKVNKKAKAKALFTILSKKFRDGEVVFLDAIKPAAPKTKEAISILQKVGSIKGVKGLLAKKNNAAYVTVWKKDEVLDRGFRNINSLKLDEVRNLNPLDVMNYKYLIIANPAEALKFLEAKLK